LEWNDKRNSESKGKLSFSPRGIFLKLEAYKLTYQATFVILEAKARVTIEWPLCISVWPYPETCWIWQWVRKPYSSCLSLQNIFSSNLLCLLSMDMSSMIQVESKMWRGPALRSSKNLRRWHINTIIDLLDIIHSPVFLYKSNVSELDSVSILR
jgi:hypothetical protein